ncbi:MAG TPA: MMPL family transporter [Candidatus Dormibacteraeota bacterium]
MDGVNRFGRFVALVATRRPWLSLVVFAILVSVATAASGYLQSRLTVSQADYTDPSTRSARARAQIYDASKIDTQEGVAVLVRTDEAMSVTSPPPALVGQVSDVLARHHEVVRVDTYATTRDPAMISKDGHGTYVLGQVGHIDERRLIADLGRELAVPGLRDHVSLGGPTAVNIQVSDVSTADLGLAESIAFPVLLVLLLIVFRGVVAALIPLIGGLWAIALTFLWLTPIASASRISIFALNLVFGLGLGLSIDFSLLLVSRYREEMARSGPGREAMLRTLSTAGVTIVFSAVTISAAVASLLVFPQPYLYSMSIAGVLVTLSAALVALVPVPAVLTLLGRRVNLLSLRRWRERDETRPSGFWYRFPHFVMRRPVLLAVAVVVVLAGLALPVTGIRFTGVDASMLPAGSSARQVADTIRSDFPAYHTSPATIVLTAPATAGSQVQAYADRVNGVAGVQAVSPARYLGRDTWVVDAFLDDLPLSDRSRAAVETIRALDAPFPLLVSGQTATLLDLDASLAAHLPIAVVLAFVTTLAILFAMTGSVVLPVKALLMSTLSLGAAFGVLVLVFQHGFLQNLLGFTSQGALESSTPLLVLALVFGLSTDYEVFLLSRIREEHTAGHPMKEAVAAGLGRTGRIVTAAAGLLCVALAALLLSRIILIKELGLGSAFAVLVDASLVRAVLVPALMAVLGDWNWWAPRPLRALHGALVPAPAGHTKQLGGAGK